LKLCQCFYLSSSSPMQYVTHPANMSTQVTSGPAALPAAEQAWKAAKDAFQGNLSPAEEAHLAHSTISDAFKAVVDTEHRYVSSSRSRQAGALLRGPLEVVARLSPALDVFSQVEPSILCPIWGSMRIMVMVAAHVDDLGNETPALTACRFWPSIQSFSTRFQRYLHAYPSISLESAIMLNCILHRTPSTSFLSGRSRT